MSKEKIQQFFQIAWLPILVTSLSFIAIVIFWNQQGDASASRQTQQQQLDQLTGSWHRVLTQIEDNLVLQQYLAVYEQATEKEIREAQVKLENVFELIVISSNRTIAGFMLTDANQVERAAYHTGLLQNRGETMIAGQSLSVQNIDQRPYIHIRRLIEGSDSGLALNLLVSADNVFSQLGLNIASEQIQASTVENGLLLQYSSQVSEPVVTAAANPSFGNSQFQIVLPAPGPGLIPYILYLLFAASLFWLYKHWQEFAGDVMSDYNDIDFRARFLASISQELRSPINGMLGMLSLVKDTRLTQEQSRLLVSVQRSAEWFSQVINDFLDFSKMDSGKIALEFIDFDIRQTVNDVAEMLSVQAYAKGVEIGCLIGSGVPSRVNGDPTRLRQIMINLLTNAIKFTEHGDVAISVTTDVRKQEGIWLRFDVADTGIGIDTEFKSSLFEPFEQGDESINKRFGGTGLGLTICRSLVDLMGGDIDAHENSQGGATFWFSLPFAEAQQDITPEIENSLAGYKILVAGEVAVNRKTILETLGEWGVICEEQTNVEAVSKSLLAAVESDTPFDACIIDVSLHLTNEKAFQTVESLRQQVLLEQTRMVLLTSDGRPGDGMLARSKGIQGYLTKPINRSQLQGSLQQIFKYENIEDVPLITRHRLREVEADEQYTVLLIEQNKKIQKQLAANLQELSCQVEVTSSVKKALGSLQHKPYDMVMVDVELLNGENGELISLIEDLDSKNGLPASRHERMHDVIPVMGLVDSLEAELANGLLDKNKVHGCIYKNSNIDHLDHILALWLHAEEVDEPDSLITS